MLGVRFCFVPREMKVEHSGGVKAMTDEELEAGIEALRQMLADREAGSNAQVIEGIAEPAAPPAPPTAKRKRRKPDGNGGPFVGEDAETGNS